MLSRCSARGFTLIELLVGMALIAVLLALGLPSLSTLLQNNKISSATANYYAGLQLARAEAIRSNLPVEFLMTNGTGVGAAPVPGGQNWVVRLLRPVPLTNVLIDQKTGLEGEGTTTQAVQVNVLVAPVGFDGRVTFNGFGAPGNPYSFDIVHRTLTCAQLPGGLARCRRINVTASGQITSCDPSVPAVAGDTRAC